MSDKIKGFVTLQSIVKDVLNDMGIYSLENYLRYMRFAVRGCTQLHLYDLNSIEVAFLDQSDVGTVTLPDDYVDYTKIGVCDSKGRIYILGLNEDICLSRTEQCGLPINKLLSGSVDTDELAELGGYCFATYNNTCNSNHTLYGITGGFAESYYRVDMEKRFIQFSSLVSGRKIVLEYISTGVSVKGDTYIEIQAQEAMIAWIHWKRKQHDGNFNQYEKREARELFYDEERLLRSFEGSFTMQELQDVFYESYTQGIKR